MDLDIMTPLGRRLKELDAEYQKQREAQDAPLEDDGAYEDATKQAEERNKKAEQKKYAFSNFPSLRAPDDFAKVRNSRTKMASVDGSIDPSSCAFVVAFLCVRVVDSHHQLFRTLLSL